MSSVAKQGMGAVIWDYLTTVDHKKIAILYLIAGGLFCNRRNRSSIYSPSISDSNNAFLVGDAYNQVLTMHGNNDFLVGYTTRVWHIM